MKRGGLKYVGTHVAADAVQLLDELLKEARSGEVIGVAVVSLRRRRRFQISYTGAVQDEPAASLGAGVVLVAEILKTLTGGK
jgi:hypothetical protein